MEAHGKEGMIQVSEDTRNLLQKAFPEKYRFEKNTDIDIKSLNKTIEGYIVYAQDREVGTNIDEEDKPFKDA